MELIWAYKTQRKIPYGNGVTSLIVMRRLEVPCGNGVNLDV